MSTYTPVVLTPPFTAQEYNDAVFKPDAHDAGFSDFSSYDMINGWFDFGNIHGVVKTEKIKNNIITKLFSANSNMNLDFFKDLTEENVTVNIPGLNKTFDITTRKGAHVLVFWTLVVTNGGEIENTETENYSAGFFLHSTHNNNSPDYRFVGQVLAGAYKIPTYIPRMDGTVGKSVLSGHTMLEYSSPGQINLGIGMIANSRHVRVHTRSLNVLVFNRG